MPSRPPSESHACTWASTSPPTWPAASCSARPWPPRSTAAVDRLAPVLASIGWPVLDRIHLWGDFAISPHGIGIAVGFLFGAWILQHEGPKRGVSVADMLALWNGGLTLLGGIAGAVLINIPLFRKYHYSFFQVMDGAVIGLAF